MSRRRSLIGKRCGEGLVALGNAIGLCRHKDGLLRSQLSRRQGGEVAGEEGHHLIGERAVIRRCGRRLILGAQQKIDILGERRAGGNPHDERRALALHHPVIGNDKRDLNRSGRINDGHAQAIARTHGDVGGSGSPVDANEEIFIGFNLGVSQNGRRHDNLGLSCRNRYRLAGKADIVTPCQSRSVAGGESQLEGLLIGLAQTEARLGGDASVGIGRLGDDDVIQGFQKDSGLALAIKDALLPCHRTP